MRALLGRGHAGLLRTGLLQWRLMAESMDSSWRKLRTHPLVAGKHEDEVVAGGVGPGEQEDRRVQVQAAWGRWGKQGEPRTRQPFLEGGRGSTAR